MLIEELVVSGTIGIGAELGSDQTSWEQHRAAELQADSMHVIHFCPHLVVGVIAARAVAAKLGVTGAAVIGAGVGVPIGGVVTVALGVRALDNGTLEESKLLHGQRKMRIGLDAVQTVSGDAWHQQAKLITFGSAESRTSAASLHMWHGEGTLTGHSRTWPYLDPESWP